MVTLYLNNSLQEDRLQHFKAEVVQHLRKVTSYPPLDLQTVIEQTQQDEGSRKYTQQEKFQYLAKKNPAMNTLKEKFDLQIDY